MTAPSLPDALATIARLDGTMRPAVEAARDCVIDDYADALYRYRSATRHPNTLALLDAASALVKHVEAETKRADAAERERDWARRDSVKFSFDFREQKRRARIAEAALAAARETIARLTAALKPFGRRHDAVSIAKCFGHLTREDAQRAHLLADLAPFSSPEPK